jgi:3'-phosphoadenosine 5'-phosphosulfate sulfotransferase (PAPS reductase)/FAD synthetase
VTSPKLTVLSFGAGQDSTALAVLLATDRDFRRRIAGTGDILAVMSETGNEFPETLEHVETMRDYFRMHGIPFYYLGTRDGYHTGTWRDGLEGFYVAHDTIGSKAFPKTCSVRLKTAPVGNFLEQLVAREYGVPNPGRKKSLYAFTERYKTKLRVVLGMAKGEEKRCAARALSLFPMPEKNNEPAWLQRNYERVYPLIDLGIDRAAAQQIIADKAPFRVPIPSNCMMCPFASDAEVAYVDRRFPDVAERWCAYEERKLAKNAGQARNLGVDGKLTRDGRPVTLREHVIPRARAAYQTHSEADLARIRFSHGHSTASAM